VCLNILEETGVPNGIGKLTGLEKLSILRVDECNVDIIEELGQLTELRVLSIFLHEWNDKLVECLGMLQKIKDLDIWGRRDQRNIGGLDAWVAPRCLQRLSTQWCCWFSTLPAWMNPSHVPGLSELYIAIREVQQAHLDILGRLPALRCLRLLVDHEDLGILGGFVIGAGSFACLGECKFLGFVGPVVYQHGAMPRLTVLEFRLSVRRAKEIASSSDGGALDLGLGNLASLKEVSVHLYSDETASDEEVKELVAALKHATNIHPNHPQLRIRRGEGTGATLPTVVQRSNDQIFLL
jgi:hypothetical protein